MSKMKVGSAFKKLLGGSKGKPKGRRKKGDKEETVGVYSDKDLDDNLELDDIVGGYDEEGGMEDMEDIKMISDDEEVEGGLEDEEEDEDEEEEERVGSFGVDSERIVMQLKETDGKMEKLMQSLILLQSENDGMKEEVGEVKDDIRKLLSIYEIVFKDINPFIDEDEEETMRLPSPFDEEEIVLPSPIIPDEEEVGASSRVAPIISVDSGHGRTNDAEELSSMIKELLNSGDYQKAIHKLKDGVESLEGKAAIIDDETDEEDYDYIEPTAKLLGRSKKGPILKEIPTDYISNVTLLRWLEFLLERLPRKRILIALDYYVSVNWISSDVRYKIVGYLRGELGGVPPPSQPYPPVHSGNGVPGPSTSTPRPPKPMAELKPVDEHLQPWNIPPNQSKHYRNGNSGNVPPGSKGRNGALTTNWRLSAEDHLKSLLFINMIAGNEIDRDRLSCREYDIELIKHALEGYHGI